jgi:hypothetical protein
VDELQGEDNDHVDELQDEGKNVAGEPKDGGKAVADELQERGKEPAVDETHDKRKDAVVEDQKEDVTKLEMSCTLRGRCRLRSSQKITGRRRWITRKKCDEGCGSAGR